MTFILSKNIPIDIFIKGVSVFKLMHGILNYVVVEIKKQQKNKQTMLFIIIDI